MADRTCDTCGETKPRKDFWGVNRTPMPTCTACRRKAKRHERYMKEKSNRIREEQKRIMRRAMFKQSAMLKNSKVASSLAEIKVVLSQIDYKIRKYNQMVLQGLGTKRTESAITHQSNRRDYYEEIKDLLMESASRGIDRSIEYYLANTYLLNKYGFPCVVKDADPWIELENEDGDDN